MTEQMPERPANRDAEPAPEPTMLPSGSAYTRSFDDLVTVAILVVLLLLLATGALLLITWSGAARPTTPTPTATPAPSATPTPDVRATQIQREILALTEVAMQPGGAPTQASTTPQVETGTPGVLLFPVVPAPGETKSVTSETAPVVAATTPSATVVSAETPTPTFTPERNSVTILLPYAAAEPSLTPTETPTPSPTPTETPTVPFIESPIETPTPTQPVVTAPPVATPTATPTITPVFTPSPTPFLVNELTAFTVASADASTIPIYRGPSSIYESFAELAAGTQITLRGRDSSGEWVYLCCAGDQLGWVRQVNAPPTGNTLPADAPEGAEPNDVRWLRIEPPPSGLASPPVSPSIPVGSYPLYRFDHTNGANPPEGPVPPLQNLWPTRERAQGAMTSPVIVSEQGVFVASADGHLYSFTKDNGDQRWRYNLGGQNVTLAPASRSPFLYVVDDGGGAFALEDRGAEAALRWSTTLQNDTGVLVAVTGINMLADTLYIGARSTGNENNYLVALDRNNGVERFASQQIPGNTLHYPTVGNQLVYVGSDEIRAIDGLNGTLVWQRDNLPPVAAPMVYSSPGPAALAELYVAVDDTRLFVLDANTGVERWNFTSGEAITGLAVDENNIYLSGVSYVKAISREDRVERWRASISGEMLGGPIISTDHVIVVTRTGSVQFLQKTDGASVHTFVIGGEVIDSVAASGIYLFAPGRENTVRAYRGVE